MQSSTTKDLLQEAKNRAEIIRRKIIDTKNVQPPVFIVTTQPPEVVTQPPEVVTQPIDIKTASEWEQEFTDRKNKESHDKRLACIRKLHPNY